MFNKTSSIAYRQYGSVLQNTSSSPFRKMKKTIVNRNNKSINQLLSYNSDVYLKVKTGLVLLVVNDKPSLIGAQKFVIHRITKIKKGVYFNFISLSSQIKLHVYSLPNPTIEVSPFNDEISQERIVESFDLQEIYAYYYQIRHADYFFSGEQHSYWELTYVDNGTLQTEVDGVKYDLSPFDLMFYTPHQFHSQRTFAEAASSYFTVMFDMNIANIDLLKNKVFHLDKETHSVLINFTKCTAADETSPYVKDLQLIYLKELIIRLISPDLIAVAHTEAPIQQQSDNELLNNIMLYINTNIFRAFSIDEICKKFVISRSSLQSLFKDNIDMPPKQYINELKLTKSKLMIKEGKYTISEIAAALGYTSIHYFSRKFKSRYGYTPTDYAKSVYN